MNLKLIIAILLLLQFNMGNCAKIKKWVDKDGTIHYGDIAQHSRDVHILDIKDPAPEITKGEKLMRMKNDLYFKQLEIQRQENQLKQAASKQDQLKRLRKQRQSLELALDRDRKACLKAKLKLADVEDDLRGGYTRGQGIRLEQNRRKLQRRIDAYC
ncbi:MAG: hypothetical protein K0U68_06280 [Gammaproteobacteria bacterium]|nr:hypothetical protein [Gammaproteobacteria bacterium]